MSDEQEKKQDETHELDAECRRCGTTLTAERCRSHFDQWSGRWHAVCNSCDSSYFGGFTVEHVKQKAERYAAGERHIL